MIAQYPFGVEKAAIVDQLRTLADLIERDEAKPQKFVISTEQAPDNFNLTTLAVTYAAPKG